jgi:hypothetical protein
MSWFQPTSVACPSCGAGLRETTAETVNIARAPQVRERILEGSFHVATCSACSHRAVIERRFMYSDFARRQFFQVFRPDDETRWPHFEALAHQTFVGGFQGAPEAMQALAAKTAVRAVFGIAALTEKLRIDEAGLDDGLIELLKLDLLRGVPDLARASAPDIVFRAAHARRDGDLEGIELAARPSATGENHVVYSVSGERYAELARERDRLSELWPGLFYKPYVSFKRLAREQPTDVDGLLP